ncbi:hypothetical protein [Undibacterium sp. TJN19]|uniref:hypothetical protein n=1 Tax=Undibacterium sp. TJN19 TaxID=3413055 RepID=UPI003BF3E99E
MTLPLSAQGLALSLLALVFVWSALDKLLHWQEGLAEVREQLRFFPVLLLSGTVLLQALGAAGLLGAAFFPAYPAARHFGGWSALALAGFTSMATVLFHAFWREASSRDVRRMLTVFLEHIALVGGLLMAATALLVT